MNSKNLKSILFLLSLVSYGLTFSQSNIKEKEVKLSAPYKIEVYTMPFCGHCKVVESKLKKHKINYEEKNIFLSKKLNKKMIEKALGEQGTPRIFINGHYIGGRRDFDKISEATLNKIAANRPSHIIIKLKKND